MLGQPLSEVWALTSCIPPTLILSPGSGLRSHGEPHGWDHHWLCSSFSSSCSSGGWHPSSEPGTAGCLPFPSCCSFAESFSKTFTGREKEELLVPFSLGDFLLKGCLGEYLQSKQSTEIASPCDILFSWVLWGAGGGDRVTHTGLPPSTVWPGPCLCRVLRPPLKSRSCKVIFSPFLISEKLSDWFWASPLLQNLMCGAGFYQEASVSKAIETDFHRQILGWTKSSFGFFRKMLWKNPNELFIKSISLKWFSVAQHLASLLFFLLVCMHFLNFFCVVQTKEAFSSLASLRISLLTMFWRLKWHFTSKFPHTHGLGEIQSSIFPVLKYLLKIHCSFWFIKQANVSPENFEFRQEQLREPFCVWITWALERFPRGIYDCIKYPASTWNVSWNDLSAKTVSFIMDKRHLRK